MARFRESTDRSETTMQLELERYVPGLLLWLSNKVSSSASPSLQREIRRRGNGMARTCLFQYLSLVHSIQGL